jgi:hypothetical protein
MSRWVKTPVGWINVERADRVFQDGAGNVDLRIAIAGSNLLVKTFATSADAADAAEVLVGATPDEVS